MDRNATHLWKPLLHEIATGVMDDDTDSLSYQSTVGKPTILALNKVRSRASIVSKNMLNCPVYGQRRGYARGCASYLLMIT